MSKASRGIRTIWLAVLLFVAGFALAGTFGSETALAHSQHRKEQQQAQQAKQAGAGVPGAASKEGGPTVSHAQMGEMMGGMDEDRSSRSFVERLLNWLGRLHPVIVHFPIAFFPAALVTAIVGRRRPAFGTPVRFLVIAGGLLAPLAALLGWFDSIGAEQSAILTAHRWLGTAIGVSGLALALWAWRRPAQDRGVPMIGALAAMTVAIVVQGWFGGEMVHGIGHMNF